jgi:hypothetical protein
MSTTPTHDKQFCLVLSKDDLAKLHALAARARLSAAEWLRQTVRSAHEKARLPAPKGDAVNRSWGPRRW